jgi:hypothetical protein
MSGPVRSVTTALALAIAGCAHAPRPNPAVQAAETQRRERLPEDHRTLDGTWDDVRVRVTRVGGRTEATLDIRKPKMRFFYQPEVAAEKGPPTEAAKQKVAEAQPTFSLPDALRKMAPFDVDRIEIHGGELVFVDMSKPARPELWLSELELSIENVASRPRLAEWRPVLLTASAKVQHSGDLAVFVTADPWSDKLNFSGRASLERLATKELYGFLADQVQLQLPGGALDLFVAFTVRDGKLTGGVKPVLANSQVRPVKDGPLARLKAWAAQLALSISSDRVRGRSAVATVLPLSGRLEKPKADLWPALTGVLYNAYVTGISAGFGGVPAIPPKVGDGQVDHAAPPAAAPKQGLTTADSDRPPGGDRSAR